MNKNCIITVATGKMYTSLQRRLLDSLAPFSSQYDVLTWTDVLPVNSPSHSDCHYCFKAFALKEAIAKGYSNILWLDSACLVTGSLLGIFSLIEEQGYYLVNCGATLDSFSSDYFLDVKELDRHSMDVAFAPLGGIFGLNVNHAVGKKITEEYLQDQEDGLFMLAYADDSARIDCTKIISRPDTSINKGADVAAHRHDEAVLGYLAMKYNCVLESDQAWLKYGAIKIDKEFTINNKEFATIGDGHTINYKILTPSSKVLDCGARGFEFAKWIVDNIGCSVVSIDADPDIEDPKIENVIYINKIITTGESAALKFYTFLDGSGNYSEEIFDRPSVCDTHVVETMKIEGYWDLIKLDIEGGEYNILEAMTAPIATQLSVEFHEHTAAKRGKEHCDKLLKKLSQWYNIYNAVWERRHGCPENYWDVLFILKQ